MLCEALVTAGDLEARVRIAMGGIAAEVMELGESSTTAADDLEKATSIAREMVGTYGMSKALGRLKLLHHSGGYLLTCRTSFRASPRWGTRRTSFRKTR